MKKIFWFLLLILAPLLSWGQPNGYVSARGPDTVKVFFDQKIKANLTIIYSKIDKELPFCLHGEVREDSIFVDDIMFPRLINISDTSAIKDSDPCKARDDYIGLIHNHGRGSCTPSPTDIRRFVYNYEALIETIVCSRGTEKFNVFVKRDVLNFYTNKN